MYYVCTTLALREQISSQKPAGKIPGLLFCTTFVLRLHYESKFQARSRPGGSRGYFFVLRLYYACTTGANLKPGAGREDPRGTFLYYVCITLALREQIVSQQPAERIPGVLLCATFVLRLYYGCKFQARSQPGGSQGYFL